MYAAAERGGVVDPPPRLDPDDPDAVFVALYNGVVPAVERIRNVVARWREEDEIVESPDFDSDSALEDMRRAIRLGL